ncbi:MAG: adenosine kinase [Candidatus Pacearchaeota archaeon]|jgi:sugar/nucleoside kinase (ribokinase family)
MAKKYDVSGIGSALLDITFHVDDEMLKELGLVKGNMTLIDSKQGKEILSKLKNKSSIISPGGSSSNTLAGVSSLGGKTLFFGKIGNDEFGNIYNEKTLEEQVSPELSKHDLSETGYAITFITPDLERTFATNLGASIFFSVKDLVEDKIKDSSILHLEGYQIEGEETRNTLLKAIEIAKKNNTLVSMDLSDSGVIKRHLDFLKDLIKNSIDIVFVNEMESLALTGKSELESLEELSKLCDVAIVKLGKDGSLIKSKDKTYKIEPNKVSVVNTNGAGDMYAAGILYGISNGFDLETAGKLASFASSQVVASSGARLDRTKKEELQKFLKKIQSSSL